MAMNVDKSILLGFVEEAHTYLPSIISGIADYLTDESKIEEIQLAYRQIHTIKGASSMVGLSELSEAASEVEEVLEEYTLVQGVMSEETAAYLGHKIEVISSMLKNLEDEIGTVQEQSDFSIPDLDMDSFNFEDVDYSSDSFANIPLPDMFATSSSPFTKQTPTPSFPTDNPVPSNNPKPSSISFPESLALDPEMLEVFSMEAEDLLRAISSGLAILDNTPDDRNTLQEVRRSVHTLKGAAGVVGFRSVAQLSHRMEDLLDRMFEKQIANNADITGLLLTSTDALERLSHGASETELQELLDNLYSAYGVLLDGVGQDSIPEIVPEPTYGIEQPEFSEFVELKSDEQTTDSNDEQTVKRGETRRVVRVPLERLDDLVKLVSELVISRSVLEQRIDDLNRQIEEIHHSAGRLRRVSDKFETEYEVSALAGHSTTQKVIGISPAIFAGDTTVQSISAQTITAHGFDELEFDRYTEFHRLSRELSETTSDTSSIAIELESLLGDFDVVMTRQRRLTNDVQERLMRLRMVPLSMLKTRLQRTVRVFAQQEGKQAEFVMEGEHIELDTTVIDQIAEPLLHLLRNAVSHGIEPPDIRRAYDKHEQGTIKVRAFRQAMQVVIEISDDGAGIDQQALLNKAIAGGFITQSQIAAMSDEDILSLVFLPGLSTARSVSEISGRGVGMDIVKDVVGKLQGTLSLVSTPCEGVTYTIRLPMTLAVSRALMIKSSEHTFAIPLNAVEQILMIEKSEIESLSKEKLLSVNGESYTVVKLSESLNLPSVSASSNFNKKQEDEDTTLPVLIAKANDSLFALVIDQLIEGREIVIKSLGSHLKHIHGIMGATIMGDGSVVPILNTAELIHGTENITVISRTSQTKQPSVGSKLLNVMIVDDSPSVRRIMSNLMKNTGWNAILCKDGFDALENLHSLVELPNVILLDVEMPRMDGYEFLVAVKSQPQLRNIPVIMITSRTGEKHRRKALELGASEYLTKPYHDEVLLKMIRQKAR